MREWGKIAIGARVRAPDPAFFVSWTGLVCSGRRPGDVVLTPAVGLPHAPAANFIAEAFLKTECDSVLFLDDDMVFSPDSCERLRTVQTDAGILSGLAVCRRFPHVPVSLAKSEDGKRPRVVYPTGPVTAVEYVGLAFTLVAREVFEAVRVKRGTEPFCWSNRLGEDGQFCEDAREAGYGVAVAGEVIIGHRVTFTARWDHAEGHAVMASDTFGLDADGAQERIAPQTMEA